MTRYCVLCVDDQTHELDHIATIVHEACPWADVLEATPSSKRIGSWTTKRGPGRRIDVAVVD